VSQLIFSPLHLCIIERDNPFLSFKNNKKMRTMKKQRSETMLSGETGTMPLQRVTDKTFARVYGVSDKTFRNWIRPFKNEIEKRNGIFYNVNQINLIVEKLGNPFIPVNQIPKAEAAILVHGSSIEKYVNATWNFAKSVLWSDQNFTSAEVNLCKDHIKEYYQLIPAEQFTERVNEIFTQFLERILLAKQYVDCFSHRYILHPCIWLDKGFAKGFTGTKDWYLKIRERRKINKSYAIEVKRTAELYAKYAVTYDVSVFPNAIKQLQGKQHDHLLKFLCRAIANLEETTINSNYKKTA
jgi:hypothetical protein